MRSVIVSIEDDLDLAEYIQKVLSDAHCTVQVANDGPRGLKLIETVNPDLVLLDLNLPTVHGESVLRDIQASWPQLPVVILTAENDPSLIARSFNLGVEDYITKPFSPEELVARVKARLRHTSSEAHQVLQLADLTMNLSDHTVERAGQTIELTPQEFKLLAFLLSNPNQVLSRDAILSRIWLTSPEIETRVVDVYVGYLRKKIDKGFATKLIQSVRGFGYMLKAQ